MIYAAREGWKHFLRPRCWHHRWEFKASDFHRVWQRVQTDGQQPWLLQSKHWSCLKVCCFYVMCSRSPSLSLSLPLSCTTSGTSLVSQDAPASAAATAVTQAAAALRPSPLRKSVLIVHGIRMYAALPNNSYIPQPFRDFLWITHAGSILGCLTDGWWMWFFQKVWEAELGLCNGAARGAFHTLVLKNPKPLDAFAPLTADVCSKSFVIVFVFICDCSKFACSCLS